MTTMTDPSSETPGVFVHETPQELLAEAERLIAEAEQMQEPSPVAALVAQNLARQSVPAPVRYLNAGPLALGPTAVNGT